MNVVRTTLLLGFLLSQFAMAVRMDETTHDQIIGRLEMGLDGMDKNEPERTGIQLRLADLLADRARLKAMNEVESGCKNCKGALNDRKKALSLYQEALPKVERADQGRRVLQIAHLYELLERQKESKALYNKIITAKSGIYTSEVKAIAYTAIGERKFKDGDFKHALTNFEAARRENLKAKAIVEFRIAWCQLNLGQNEKAIATMTRLLKSPEVLKTQTTNGQTVDPIFVADLSHDLAVFLAHGQNVGPRQIRLVRELSPDGARKTNLYALATECDRLGKKSASLVVLSAYVEEGDVQPNEKLDVQTKVAQIYYDMNMQDVAAQSYEKALSFWKTLGCKAPMDCEGLKTQLKKFVTAWNKSQKKHPTANLLRVYVAYTNTFPDDTEMLHWGGIVAQSMNKYKQAADLFHKAAFQASIDLKKDPKSKSLQNIFEGSLLAEIEMSEAGKDPKAQEAAYNNYLTMNPNGKEAFEVRYQRAQLFYSTNRLHEAFSEFHYLASLQINHHREMRVKSADLALDCLVGLKDDPNLQTRSLEYARLFPERKTEYLKISRKATMNIVATNLKNEKANDRTDYKANLAAMANVNMDGADDAEKIKFYKNKLILGQKALDLNVVNECAAKLLAVKSLNAEDKDWTLTQKVWVAELELNFAEAYRLSQQLPMKDLSKADRELRLALLADLAGKNPRKHNEAFLAYSNNVRASNMVRVTMIRNASNPWRELDKHLKYLKQTPDLLAGIALEAYSVRPDQNRIDHLLRTTKIGRYAAGATLQRRLDLKDFERFDKKIRRHRIYSANESTLQSSLKKRLTLLNESERRTQQSFRRGDWTMKVISLAQLSRENMRLYKDIQSLPVPRRLNAKDRAKYQALLKAQSAPYYSRAQKIESELQDMWNESNSLQKLQSAYMAATPELQKMYREEITPLAISAPPSVKNRLHNLLNTPFRRPSQKDVLLARRELQASPFDISKAEKLRDLESQNGRAAMVVYLDERISSLKKGNAL
jgi:hypothetical protein